MKEVLYVALASASYKMLLPYDSLLEFLPAVLRISFGNDLLS